MVPAMTDPMLWHKVAAVSGVAALGLGTYGAHMFHPENPAYKEVWHTASLYHLVHTAALLGAPITKRPNIFGGLLTAGIVLFSGTCYTVAYLEDRKFSSPAPLGGFAFIAAWWLLDLGAEPIIEKGLGDDQHPSGYEGALDPWLLSLWKLPNLANPSLLPRISDIIHPNLSILGDAKVEVIYYSSDDAPQDSDISDSKKLIERARSMSPALQFHNDGEPQYMLQMVTNQRLTKEDSDRDVHHIELEDTSSAISYQVGDALEILPSQNPSAVDAFIERCNLDPDCYIMIRAKGADKVSKDSLVNGLMDRVKLKTFVALTMDVASASPWRYFFEVMSFLASAEHEKEKLQYFASPEGRDDLYQYNRKESRIILEMSNVSEDFPLVQMSFEWLVQLTPPLKKRAFSMSSSPLAHPNQIHLTVSIVSWLTPFKRTRHGLCSTWLVELCPNEGQESKIKVVLFFIMLPWQARNLMPVLVLHSKPSFLLQYVTSVCENHFVPYPYHLNFPCMLKPTFILASSPLFNNPSSSPPTTGDRMITITSPSNQEYIRDVAEIDLQDYKDVESFAFYQVPANLGSGLSMESERSLRVNICTDHSDVNFLHKLLHHLVEYKENYRNVVSLLFHGIEWQTEGVQLLCSFLGPGSSVKQLEFQKNVFSTKSAAALVPFSEMLQRNNTVKAVVFSDCRIGAKGATLLASALANNRSVEEFQLWEDSIGAKGAEELSKMIEVNYMLKLLIILDNSSIAAAPLISAVLARNRRVEVHMWGHSRDTRGGMNSCKIVEFLPETGSMRIYNNINSTGLQRVACALAWNTTVTTLDMSGVPLKSKWTKELRGVLERNSSLKVIKLTRCCLGDKAVVYIAAGLFKNKYLESLSLDGNRFGGVGLEHLLCPLSTFSPLQTQANTTLKVLSFGGERTNVGRYGIAAILQMLETNQSLIQLAICDDASLRSNDVVKIFTSLERNATLRSLSLKGCKGVEGAVVLQTIMNTLQVNPWIEEIDLHGTPLHVAGKTDQIYEKLGQNGSLVLPNDLLDLPLSAPTCCRVFLCGQELAGKSTLCSSINQCMDSMKLPRMDVITTLKTPVEQMAYTNENKMNSIFDGDTKLTMCNLGGHEGGFALHDFMFVVHGGPSFFMIVSSLVGKPATKYPKSIDEIEWELIYWLKFLISNSRRRVSQSSLPCVTIVLTHYDKVPHLPEGLQPIASVVQRLREDFRSHAEIYPTVFAVDSRSLASVSRLTHHLRKTTKTILQQVPQVYEVCNDLVKILHDWRLKNKKAVIRWAEFCEICQLNIPVLRLRSRRDNVEKVDARRRAVAKSLHYLGEIIFFEELGVLIMNCEWFCRDVLSQLAALKSIKIENSGFVRKQELEKILQEKLRNQIPRSNWRAGASLQASDIINMLLELELCYEQDPGNQNTLLLVPAILEESNEGTQRWQLTMPECRYVGRHLECEDIHMLLTTDFFPRLQVRLHNKIMCLGQQQLAVYNLEKNLIYTVINGVHVRVELGMKLGSSIDVLACSSKNVTDMVRLLHKLVIPTILNLSPSMTFKESIIRSDCVKYPIPQRFRTTQLLPLKKIKQILLSLPAESMYDYQHTWTAVESNRRLILRSGSDHARDLLSDDDFHEVLHRRYYDLQHLATELAVAPDNLQQSETIPEADVVDPSILGVAKGVEMVLQRLKRIEQGIRDLKEEIASLRYYEYHLLNELHRKMDYVMNYSIQLEERKVPQMFYLVSLENRSKKLVTRVLPGMRSLRLHMLCEFRREMHVVEDQVGCDLIQVDNQTVQSLLPYMGKFMKLLTFALKIGAHFIVGMGEMIPDLSREVVHLLDSSAMYGAAASAASLGALGAAAMFGKARKNSNQSGASDMGEDMKAARQWLVDFLKGQGILTGMDIARRFGLWRVRYRDDGHIAWICRKHIAAREEEIFELPL